MSGPPRQTAGGATAFHSASAQEALQRLTRFARDDTASILLQGESGTGKTQLAKLVHELSPRSRGPFLQVVLSTLDVGVASSELFGHVAGAFTGAQNHRAGLFVSANGGTIFLDEIGKVPLPLQGMLLNVIEYGVMRPVGADRDVRVNVRIVAATNVALEELVERGSFLADLYARLKAFRVTIPPLRERRADIPALVRESVHRHAKSSGYGDNPPGIHEDLMEALRRAPWPNNLRELDTTVHRIMLEAAGAPCLTLGHCVDDLSYLATGTPARQLTAEVIKETLRQEDRNLSAAARRLGVDRKTLRLKRDSAG